MYHIQTGELVRPFDELIKNSYLKLLPENITSWLADQNGKKTFPYFYLKQNSRAIFRSVVLKTANSL